MTIFPPIPPSDGLHPIIVHFPVALLLTAPVFLVLAAAWAAKRREMLLAAFIMVLLGTIGAMAATWSGEEGEHAARGDAGAKSVLHEHEDLGELARNLFIGVTVALGLATAFVFKKGERLSRRAGLLTVAVLLLAYVAPALVLANAAHLGGRLVHELGVRARVTDRVTTTGDSLPVPARDGDD